MKPKIRRKLKRIFNLYNLLILVCITVTVVSIVLFIKPDFTSWFGTKYKEVDGVKIVLTEMKEDDEIKEDQAKRVGVKQFKLLGEKDIKESDLKIQKIQRKGVEYYYITSSKNTMEIKIKGGIVSRINAVFVE